MGNNLFFVAGCYAQDDNAQRHTYYPAFSQSDLPPSSLLLSMAQGC